MANVEFYTDRVECVEWSFPMLKSKSHELNTSKLQTLQMDIHRSQSINYQMPQHVSLMDRLGLTTVKGPIWWLASNQNALKKTC